MARYKTRGPQDALNKKIGKISTKRKPRHPDNALFAISHIHRVVHNGQRRFFSTREVYETVKSLHAERNDEVPLGKLLESAIHNHILKTLVKAGYLEFNGLKTQIKVTPAGSEFLNEVAENVKEMEMDSPVTEHRAHCDYFRQQVGPLAKLTNKQANEVEVLEEKVEEYERHQRHCPAFAASQPFERASSVAATDIFSDAGVFEEINPLHTPESSMDSDRREEQDVTADVDMSPLSAEATSSQAFATPAAVRKPIHSTPFNNPYMTPETMPRMRPQRTITQATITPPPSPPYGTHRALTPQVIEPVEDNSMMVDDYDPDTTLVHSFTNYMNEEEHQELEALREENKSYKAWAHHMASLFKPWWSQKTFNSTDTDEILNSACRVVTDLQFAEADVLEVEDRLKTSQNELAYVESTSNAQITSLSTAMTNAQQAITNYQQQHGQDEAELRDMEEELEATKYLFEVAVEEKKEAMQQIRSMFMGAGNFLAKFGEKDQQTSISAGPILRRA